MRRHESSHDASHKTCACVRTDGLDAVVHGIHVAIE